MALRHGGLGASEALGEAIAGEQGPGETGAKIYMGLPMTHDPVCGSKREVSKNMHGVTPPEFMNFKLLWENRILVVNIFVWTFLESWVKTNRIPCWE